ncbi:MAG: outer membrane beta-barrel protein [Chitinophagales bacterium]|nr:outer membrane beta-barrel protein [Chitinophagales bacterium]
MKQRVLLASLLVMVMVIPSFAQKGFQIAANVSPGLSYMLAQNTYYLGAQSKELDYKAKFSFNAGLLFGYNFVEKHGVQLFAGYCKEGQRYEDNFKWRLNDLNGTHQKEVDFSFLNLGVMYRFSPILKGQAQKNPNGNYGDGRYKIRMKLEAGVETDIMLSADMSYKVTKDDGSTIDAFALYPHIPIQYGGYGPYADATLADGDYEKYFRKFQACLAFKYGFDYIFKNNMYFGLGLHVKAGLNDINASDYKSHPDYKKSKNYFLGLNFEIGYMHQKNDDKKSASKTQYPKYKQKTERDKNYKVDTLDKKTKKATKKKVKGL